MKPMVVAVSLIGGLALLAACGARAARPASGGGLAPQAGGSGAVETVTTNGDNRFVETVQEMLRGHVAGLQVVDTPDCGVTLRIRGMTTGLMAGGCDREPLLIIDGKPIALGGIADALRGLLPLEIDRIQVLKDVASTSVYGTRGANGVVIITTKH
ncbi:MAG TPA: TonB-dependent receptor plug domain-containing protein [Longimicrobiales bacterium]